MIWEIAGPSWSTLLARAQHGGDCSRQLQLGAGAWPHRRESKQSATGTLMNIPLFLLDSPRHGAVRKAGWASLVCIAGGLKENAGLSMVRG